VTRALVCLLLAAAVTGCGESKPAAEASPAAAQQQEAATSAPTPPAPKVDSPKLDATRAFQYVKDLCAMGPRPVGSPAHKKMEDYIIAHLGGAEVQNDVFPQDGPGKKPLALRNIVAKFPGTKDGIIVLASHYDTKMIPEFVGANDGASSTGLLLGIADQLRAGMKNGKREGYSVWLVFFDGEEAFEANINDTDGLYGSKHLAAQWQKDATAAKIKAFLLADMIGDKDLNVLRDLNSTPWLLDWVAAAAEQLYSGAHFYSTQTEMIDDHIPFKQIGVPVADLIDFDYGYANAFWHTKDDTIDKLSPQSLQVVGDVMLRVTWMLDKKDK
jgi:hypothetical protein